MQFSARAEVTKEMLSIIEIVAALYVYSIGVVTLAAL